MDAKGGCGFQISEGRRGVCTKVTASCLSSYRKGKTGGIKCIQRFQKNLKKKRRPFRFPTLSDEPPDVTEPREEDSFKGASGTAKQQERITSRINGIP